MSAGHRTRTSKPAYLPRKRALLQALDWAASLPPFFCPCRPGALHPFLLPGRTTNRPKSAGSSGGLPFAPVPAGSCFQAGQYYKCFFCFPNISAAAPIYEIRHSIRHGRQRQEGAGLPGGMRMPGIPSSGVREAGAFDPIYRRYAVRESGDALEQARSAPRMTSTAMNAIWGDKSSWYGKTIRNTARMGWFSSDRTIRQYSKDIWRA